MPLMAINPRRGPVPRLALVMNPPLPDPGAWAAGQRVEALPESEAQAILATAKAMHRRGLECAASNLRGRYVGLLCDRDAGEDIELLRLAVAELGGRVAHVQSSLGDSTTVEDLQKLAHFLGRFYDAIECQGLSAEQVHELARDAGVPVFDGIATSSHPTARLARCLDCEATDAEKRRLVLKAALLHALA